MSSLKTCFFLFVSIFFGPNEWILKITTIIVIIIIASVNVNGHTEEELFFEEKTVEDYVSA